MTPKGYMALAVIGTVLIGAGTTAAGRLFPLPTHPEIENSTEIAFDKYITGLQKGDYTVYVHPTHTFSFPYPKEFNVAEFEDPDGEVVLFHNPAIDWELQVYITPIDDNGSLTPERIGKDNPLLAIANPVEAFLTDDTPAIRFGSRDENGAETRELWFIRQGYLYQFTMAGAPGWLDELIKQLAGDLSFLMEATPYEALIGF